MATKTTFASHCMNAASTFIQTSNQLNDLANVMTANGWQSGGTNQITDSDLTGLNITTAQLNSFITLCSKFLNLMNNQAVSGTIDGKAICNVMRTDL